MAGRYIRPGWLVARVLNPLVSALGATTLEVTRRRTGGIQRVPVNVLDHAGARYLVSLRGNTEWTRNLRAAGRCTVRSRFRRSTYRAVELPPEQRHEIIEAYRARWSGPANHFLAELPDVADHPVFRLEATD